MAFSMGSDTLLLLRTVLTLIQKRAISITEIRQCAQSEIANSKRMRHFNATQRTLIRRSEMQLNATKSKVFPSIQYFSVYERVAARYVGGIDDGCKFIAVLQCSPAQPMRDTLSDFYYAQLRHCQNDE